MPMGIVTLDVSEIVSCICFLALTDGGKQKKLPKMGSCKTRAYIIP